ncbi:MAG: class I tRNA ligase family protein [Bacteroidota bacterium]
MYNFKEIEAKWQAQWAQDEVYKVEENDKEKFYVLDMFPYPSGAGLHVGHPLGYIASDIVARYKKLRGFNVLHPMGFDSFGLPAEQYAIQTGQHPAITTATNIKRYKEQLKRIGFNYDWNREVQTSDPNYYKWTQWIFKQIYNSWYNKDTDKAEPISTLIEKFENNGTYNVEAGIEEDWFKELNLDNFPFGEHFAGEFTATDWASMNAIQREKILSHFRLTYLSDTWVNWCPELGTVLANDEVKDGVSERGGYPVVKKLMRQWSMRISAYAQRLLDDLEGLDWSDSIKEVQRNWIGRSDGAMIRFELENHAENIEVFTTRPDTIFGVSFMTLAPEHPLVETITTSDQKDEVNRYVEAVKNKSERDRQANAKTISGAFTGAYAIHPFSGEKVPIWISEYVLMGYGTGAVMAVPSGDQRDYDFAKHFNLAIPPVFEDVDISESANPTKDARVLEGSFLAGLTGHEAIKKSIEEIEGQGFGNGKVNYRMRDAIFSRQRYWGEPFPVYFENELPRLLSDEELPLTLPSVDKYLPTEDGDPPLGRAHKDDWPIFKGDRMECNTMPGWAGSCWYWLRYMDPSNSEAFCDPEKMKYWGNVDLYLGGAEHGTGHLLYSRFWVKILYDLGFIHVNEPFQKMINQGMIGGVIEYILMRKEKTNGQAHFMCKDLAEKEGLENFVKIAVRTDIVSEYGQANSYLTQEALQQFSKWMPEFEHATFECGQGVLRDGNFESKGGESSWLVTKSEQGKMGKRYHNTVDPVEICDHYGADTLRLYEMFLGPLEQHKPWDTNGITGVHGFLKKLFKACTEATDESAANKKELKAIHTLIKKATEDIDRHSFNTVVSAFMIALNELNAVKSKNKEIFKTFAILISPYAPHIAEEMWKVLGQDGYIVNATWPAFNEEYLTEDSYAYPISFNGKMRFKLELPMGLSKEDIEKEVMAFEKTAQYLDGKDPKKVIVVPNKIVNVVV